MNTDRRAYIAERVANEPLTGWLSNHALLTDGDFIEAVVPADNLPTDLEETHEVYNLGSVSLLPGLLEAHCHMHCSATHDNFQLARTETVPTLLLRSADNMRRCLLSGVTTVRDLGSRNEVAFAVKKSVEDGVIPGPKLMVAGTPITITGGHCWFFGTEADTEEEVVSAVRRQVRMGAEVVKIMGTGGLFTPTSNPRLTQYDASTLRRAVEECERMGAELAVHTLSAKGVENCAKAGVHHIIHARWLDAQPSNVLQYDDDVAKKIADNGQWVDPTIAHLMRAEEMVLAGDAPPQLPHRAVAGSMPAPEEHLEMLARMEATGVRFTAGLDMGMFGGRHDNSAANAWALHEQLKWDRWRAIRTATAVNAEALRVDQTVGRLRHGLKADLAAFDGDPAERIRDLNIASSVVRDGVPVKVSGEVLV